MEHNVTVNPNFNEDFITYENKSNGEDIKMLAMSYIMYKIGKLYFCLGWVQSSNISMSSHYLSLYYL